MESIEFKSLRSNEILRLRRLLALCTGARRERLEQRLTHLEAREAALTAPAWMPVPAAAKPDIPLR